MFALIRRTIGSAFWDKMFLNKIQGVLVGTLSLTTTSIVATGANCPDYSQYSKEYHAPFSAGRYNLSYMRPEPACRTFESSLVEDTIVHMKSVITDPDLYRLFQNSFPNTLDTAIKWRGFAANNSREELTFLITGDINVSFPCIHNNLGLTHETGHVAPRFCEPDAELSKLAPCKFQLRFYCQSVSRSHQPSSSLHQPSPILQLIPTTSRVWPRTDTKPTEIRHIHTCRIQSDRI
jgi:hypothetical protein